MRTVDVLLVYFMVRLSILKDIIFERCNITNQIMTFSNMFGISIMVVCKIVQAFALLCDGGTDDGGDKDFVILECVFDEGASCSLKKSSSLCRHATSASTRTCLRPSRHV